MREEYEEELRVFEEKNRVYKEKLKEWNESKANNAQTSVKKEKNAQYIAEYTKDYTEGKITLRQLKSKLASLK